MNTKNANYIRELVENAYFAGAKGLLLSAARAELITPSSLQFYMDAIRTAAKVYARELRLNEKAPRCANSGGPKREDSASNLQAVPTTPGAPAQLPPLSADLEGLAVSVGVLAGRVSAEDWEFLKILRTNLRAVAERVAALENGLEVPHEQA